MRVGDCCSWEQFFKSIFSRFPIKPKERKNIQGNICQGSNSFSDSAFCCKSEIRISKSQSRFPNRSCFTFDWCLVTTRDFSLTWRPVLTWGWIKMAQRKRSRPTASLLHVDSFIYSFLYENRTQLSQVAPSLCFSFYKAEGGGGAGAAIRRLAMICLDCLSRL